MIFQHLYNFLNTCISNDYKFEQVMIAHFFNLFIYYYYSRIKTQLLNIQLNLS